jgi:biotin carboxylase
VTLLDSPAAVNDGWSHCIAAVTHPAIVEGYVEGREYSVETLTLRGEHVVLAITEKLTSGPPSFIEIGHQLPARLSEEETAEVKRVVEELLRAVGHEWGPAHTELILSTERGPVIIETHTRFGGDQIWEMVELVVGTRLAAATVAGLLGIRGSTCVPPAGGGAAIRYFAHENATVVGVSGVEAAQASPGIVRVAMLVSPGQALGALKGSRNRQGYVLAIGDNVEEAVERAEKAHMKVVFELQCRKHAGNTFCCGRGLDSLGQSA